MSKTPAEKARETRARHKEVQKARDREREKEKAIIKAGLLSILDSEDATPAEKLEARQMLKRDFYI